MLAESTTQLTTLAGSEWEDAAKKNVAFFAVASCLLDPNTQVPTEVASIVQAEVDKVTGASGTSECAITGTSVDYADFKPRSYYESDAQLSNYFRAMKWYGTLDFGQGDESLNRSGLLMVLALDPEFDGTPDKKWEAIYTVTSFFAGASEACGFYEYFPLVQASYGDSLTIDGLKGDAESWKYFCELAKQVEAPKVIGGAASGNGAQGASSASNGMRFMGERFALDQAIFRNLTSGAIEGDRTLPDTLDIPAAFGSDTALELLEAKGATSAKGYKDGLQQLRTAMAQKDKGFWEESLQSQWLYTLNPLLAAKAASFPGFMTSKEWSKKNLQTYLSSYTEMGHDLMVYLDYQEVLPDGYSVDGTTTSGAINKANSNQKDFRGYVEPEPETYARLASLSKALSAGMQRYGILMADDIENLAKIETLATQLSQIATKELAGAEPSDDEQALIMGYGSKLRTLWGRFTELEEKASNAASVIAKIDNNPAAVITDVATDASRGVVLESATGSVKTMYVIAPIGGELRICVGGTLSYYEFEQDQNSRLSDSEWREMIGVGASKLDYNNQPSSVDWDKGFTGSSR